MVENYCSTYHVYCFRQRPFHELFCSLFERISRESILYKNPTVFRIVCHTAVKLAGVLLSHHDYFLQSPRGLARRPSLFDPLQPTLTMYSTFLYISLKMIQAYTAITGLLALHNATIYHFGKLPQGIYVWMNDRQTVELVNTISRVMWYSRQPNRESQSVSPHYQMDQLPISVEIKRYDCVTRDQYTGSERRRWCGESS